MSPRFDLHGLADGSDLSAQGDDVMEAAALRSKDLVEISRHANARHDHGIGHDKSPSKDFRRRSHKLPMVQ